MTDKPPYDKSDEAGAIHDALIEAHQHITSDCPLCALAAAPTPASGDDEWRRVAYRRQVEAERDAARAEADGLRRLLEVAHADVAAAVAERDELRRRVEGILQLGRSYSWPGAVLDDLRAALREGT